MKVLSRTLSLMCLACLIAPPALQAGGAGKVSGRVTNATGDGVFGAVVTIFRQDQDGGTITFTRSTRAGAYTFPNLNPGKYYVQVSHAGFQPLTTSNVKVLSGRTTTFNVVLQDLLDTLSAEPDERNWDTKSVMRSTSDRRLIFRDLPGAPGEVSDVAAFTRSASIDVASSAGLSGETYSVFPSGGQNGTVSNFAFTEPVGDHGRMIFSGQMSQGFDSYWQVRNTYNSRPDSDRDYRFSVGYGRLSLNTPSLGVLSRPTDFFQQDAALRESGAQLVRVGSESRSRIFDSVELNYGFDYTRIYYGSTKSFFSPFLQVIVTPDPSWFIKSSYISRRLSRNNIVELPDGETLNLMEPTYITKVDGDVRMSQFRHSEVSVGRNLPGETVLEMALYEDHMDGPGTPFVVTTATGSATATSIEQLSQEQSAQHGMRLALNRQFMDFLNGSIAYVYGTGMNARPDEDLTSDAIARDLLRYIQRSYYHSLTGQIVTRLPVTGTNVTAVVRWYPRHSLTPIDLFGDSMDSLTKGVNLMLRQPIPVPEFMSTTGRWEAMIDIRNLFDQGQHVLKARDGFVLLTRNPRSLRFGIHLNLY